MEFELLDRYLLSGSPAKADVVATLLSSRVDRPEAAPFYEGMRMLGARTPDLTLYALRLVLAGKRADDDAVVALRSLGEQARKGDRSAREAFEQALA